jgi:hypothetical protein
LLNLKGAFVMPDNITARQAALWFAAKGYPVLPLHSVTENGTCTCGSAECQSPGKHPYAQLAQHGLKDASADAATVRKWFDEAYWLNYGVATDRLLVVDVDTKNNGLETWQAMCTQPTRTLPHTWTVRTGGGGLHVIFDNTEAIRNGELDKVSAATSSARTRSMLVGARTGGCRNVRPARRR